MDFGALRLVVMNYREEWRVACLDDAAAEGIAGSGRAEDAPEGVGGIGLGEGHGTGARRAAGQFARKWLGRGPRSQCGGPGRPPHSRVPLRAFL